MLPCCSRVAPFRRCPWRSCCPYIYRGMHHGVHPTEPPRGSNTPLPSHGLPHDAVTRPGCPAVGLVPDHRCGEQSAHGGLEHFGIHARPLRLFLLGKEGGGIIVAVLAAANVAV